MPKKDIKDVLFRDLEAKQEMIDELRHGLQALHDLHPCEKRFRRLCSIEAILAKAEAI